MDGSRVLLPAFAVLILTISIVSIYFVNKLEGFNAYITKQNRPRSVIVMGEVIFESCGEVH